MADPNRNKDQGDRGSLGGGRASRRGSRQALGASAALLVALAAAGCVDVCGDGIMSPLEECEGEYLAGFTCEALGFHGGELACGEDCAFDTTGCIGCGSGRVDPGEACDGEDLAGQTCQSLGYTGGVLACTAACQFDPAGCEPAPAGLGLTAAGIASSTVSLSWNPVDGMTGARVFLGPEPPSQPGAPLPDSVLLEEIAGPAVSAELSGLAPGVHHFLRVEVDAPGGTVAGNTHALTLGGPNASLENGRLDNGVREVLGFSPRTLLVVLAQTDVWVGPGDAEDLWRKSLAEAIHGTTFGALEGDLYQAGPWTVTRVATGAPVPVAAVRRHSLPVGTPRGIHVVGVQDGYASVEAALEAGDAYPPETWHDVRNKVLNVDHRIYLVLEEPVGERGVLRIQGPGSVDLLLPFSDRYLETPVVQLNQVGYSPRARQRYAYLYGYAGDGPCLDFADFPSHVQVLDEPADILSPRLPAAGQDALPTSLRREADADGGGKVLQVDLASLPAKEGGYYRVRVPGVGVSWRTAVSETAVLKAFYVLSRGMFLNRWGGDLEPECTDWPRPPDHPLVYVPEVENLNYFTESPRSGQQAYCEAARGAAQGDPSRQIALDGGYHDAGDFDQRPMHVRVPQLLMRLVELNRAAFDGTDGQLTIPESGNGIPDILDEALWGVRAWERLQAPDGCVRLGVETYMHPLFSPAHLDDLPYVTYGCHKNITARAAGLFAQAARLLGDYEAQAPGRAAELRARAVAAYGNAKPQDPAPEFVLYASGELYRLTRDPAYRADFLAAWDAWDQRIVGNWIPLGHDVDGGEAYPGFLLAFLHDPLLHPADEPLRDRFETLLENRCSELRAQFDGLAHRNPRPAGYALGYGQATSPMRYLYGMSARLEMLDPSWEEARDLFDHLSLAADYLLGANPNGTVYITGLGTRRVMNPLWVDSVAFHRQGMGHMPGFPVFGPAAFIPWYSATMALAFHPDFDAVPKGLQWADVDPVASWNEGTIWESQAPQVLLVGALLARGMMPPASWKPSALPGGGADHANPLPF